MQAFHLLIAACLLGSINCDVKRQITIGYSWACPKEGSKTEYTPLTQTTPNGNGVVVHRAGANPTLPPVPGACKGAKVCAVVVSNMSWLGTVKVLLSPTDAALTAATVKQRSKESRPVALGLTAKTLLIPSDVKEYLQAPECDLAAVKENLAGEITPSSPEYASWGFRTLQELEQPRIVAIGDLHGDLTNAKLTMRGLGLVDRNMGWLGGPSTTFVQTGDVIDRGPAVNEIMQALEDVKTAAKGAGSTVHLLMGNHEVLNVKRDWRYVTSKIAQDPAKFDQLKKDFLPGGSLYKIVESHNMVASVDGNVFCHGGISAEFAAMGIDTINKQAHDSLKAASNAGVLKEALAAPDKETAPEKKDAGTPEGNKLLPNALNKGESAGQPKAAPDAGGAKQAQAPPEANKPKEDSKEKGKSVLSKLASKLLPGKRLVRRSVGIYGTTSPIWYRKYAEDPENTACPELETALATLKMKRMIVGHTIQKDHIPHVRCNGKIVLIDIAISAKCHDGGHVGGVEIRGDKIWALSDDGWRVLFEPKK